MHGGATHMCVLPHSMHHQEWCQGDLLLHPQPLCPPQTTPFHQSLTHAGACCCRTLPAAAFPCAAAATAAAAWSIALSFLYRRFMSSLPGVARPRHTDNQNTCVVRGVMHNSTTTHSVRQ